MIQIGKYQITKAALWQLIIGCFLAGLPIGVLVAANQDGHKISGVWIILYYVFVIPPAIRWVRKRASDRNL